MSRIPWKSVHWPNSIFLMGTMLLSFTAVPAYLWFFGIDWFLAGMFLVMFVLTGLSITLGYHRLFSHISFKAKWPVRLGTLLFGAAAFENSALIWCCDHRRHHKHVDKDEDPYDISQGFWHAHMGWIMFKLKAEPPIDNVDDLRKDPLVMWQDRHCVAIGGLVGLALPALLGFLWNGPVGALGGLLIAGVARVFFVQHMTFFINSLCHTIGRQTYSSRCSARDSGFMAFLTFGEGYHNFHHEFQHDYRNGPKKWQFDPTKWAIWSLSKLGLAGKLRRVPNEKILLAELAEKHRQLEAKISAQPNMLPESLQQMWKNAQERLHGAAGDREKTKREYLRATEKKLEESRERILHLKHEFDVSVKDLREAIRHWQEAHQTLLAEFA